MSRLVANLSAMTAGASRHVVISSVAGMGGIGKTTLAVHVACRVRDRFPDGQLYAHMRGTNSVAARPGDVLATFLRQLGVAATAVPDSDEERGALYRSLLADRRVLVLLDDAKDAAHVKPLIPGGSGCAVLITTRNRLNGLAGAAHLDLDTLTRPESHALLTRVIGRRRTEADPQAT